MSSVNLAQTLIAVVNIPENGISCPPGASAILVHECTYIRVGWGYFASVSSFVTHDGNTTAFLGAGFRPPERCAIGHHLIDTDSAANQHLRTDRGGPTAVGGRLMLRGVHFAVISDKETEKANCRFYPLSLPQKNNMALGMMSSMAFVKAVQMDCAK